MTSRAWRLRAVLGLIIAVAGCAELRARYAGPDVVYIATPQSVGVEMLRMASVTAQDVVYDLGSGDGRVVIAAAREFGARGVGVEIDADLLQTSRETARNMDVADRTTFLWQDLFATDLRPATVVTLYLRDDINLRLRPKLLGELAPGSRVVSHDFDMGDWKPDRIQRVSGPVRNHTLLLWVIPADVAGVWQLRARERDAVLNLTQRYQVLGGTLSLDGRELPVTEGRMSGGRIGFMAGGQAFAGRVTGDTLAGEDWSARRLR